MEGEGAAYPAGSRATKGITVQVTDETGRPADGVTVSFRLPGEGPGGVFATGAQTEIVTTRADGRAGVWGMRWNRTLGSFEIRVTAAKGPARAGTVCVQHLTDAPAKSHLSASRGHKWLWIALAAAGAAAGGVAAVELLKSSSSPATSSAAGALLIGAPTISLGHP